jgi:hypothetical protein
MKQSQVNQQMQESNHLAILETTIDRRRLINIERKPCKNNYKKGL